MGSSYSNLTQTPLLPVRHFSTVAPGRAKGLEATVTSVPSAPNQTLTRAKFSKHDPAAVSLPRGGVLVSYGTGSIQFGIPPDSLKDSLSLGFDVPSTLVILGEELFDMESFTCIAEIDTIVYYNFFVCGKRTKIIGTSKILNIVKDLFQLSCFGPSGALLAMDKDFYWTVPGGVLRKGNQNTYWPDFVLEGCGLDENRGYMSLETFLECHETDGLSTKVIIDEASSTYLKWNPVLKKHNIRQKKFHLAQVGSEYVRQNKYTYDKEGFSPFIPPEFGITSLGNSNGFDPSGDSSGCIIWILGKGVLINPPAGITDILRSIGIPLTMLVGVVITHCRDNCDAGAFEFLMLHERTYLYTTTTIKNSFVYKYSLITGFDQSVIESMFIFKTVLIGHPNLIAGAVWDFFYGVFLIPLLSIDVKYNGLGIVYSGSTCVDEQTFDRMRKLRYVGKCRYYQLKERSALKRDVPSKGYFPIIVHEVGRPPMHSQLEYLCTQPEHVRDRIYALCNPENLDAEHLSAGLKCLPALRTLHLETQNGEHVQDKILFDQRCAKFSHILKDLPKIKGYFCTDELLDSLISKGQVCSYPTGSTILKHENGENSQMFIAILAGIVTNTTRLMVNQQPVPETNINLLASELEVVEKLYVGDILCDSSLTEDIDDDIEKNVVPKTNLTCVAETSVTTFEISMDKLVGLVSTTEKGNLFLQQIMHTQERKYQLEDIMIKNRLLNQLTNSQKEAFVQLVSPVKVYEKYDEIDTSGDIETCLRLVVYGSLEYASPNGYCELGSNASDLEGNTPRMEETMDYSSCSTIKHIMLTKGALIGNPSAVIKGINTRYVLSAKSSVGIREIPRDQVHYFVSRFPGIKLRWGKLKDDVHF